MNKIKNPNNRIKFYCKSCLTNVMKKQIFLIFIVTLFMSCKVENEVFTPKEYFIFKGWKKDTNGCKFRKSKHIRTVANGKFNNKSQKFIVSLLGEPNIKEKYTYSTGEEAVSFEYYFDSFCENNQRIDSADNGYLVFVFISDKLVFTEIWQ